MARKAIETTEETAERRARRRAERGATLVEYALFVCLFSLVAIGAVDGMNRAARAYFEDSSSRISQPINVGPSVMNP